MAVEAVLPHVIEEGVRAGFTAAGLPIVSPSSHPVEPSSPPPSAVSQSPAEPLTPATLPNTVHTPSTG